MQHRVNHDYREVERAAAAAADGEREAANKLLQLSEHIVLTAVATVRDAHGDDREELAQHGRIALWKAMKSYRPQAGTWLGYARTAARRAIYRHAEVLRKQRKRNVSGADAILRNSDDLCSSPLDQVLALEDLRERLDDARQTAAAEVAIASEHTNKHSEIITRQRHGLPVTDDEALRPIEVRPADRIRIALIQRLALQRLLARPRPAKPASTEGRDFFPECETRQGAGAPGFASEGLLAKSQG